MPVKRTPWEIVKEEITVEFESPDGGEPSYAVAVGGVHCGWHDSRDAAHAAAENLRRVVEEWLNECGAA